MGRNGTRLGTAWPVYRRLSNKLLNNLTLVDKVEAMAALACIRSLTPAALRVGIRLLHHYNCGTGRCDPGIKTLATATGLSERSAQRAVGELETSQLFRVSHRRGRRNTNSYRPDLKRIKAHNATHVAGFADDSPEDSGKLTAVTQKPDKLSRKIPTAMSGEHMNEHLNEHMKEHMKEISPERQSNPIEPATNFAQRRNRQGQERDTSGGSRHRASEIKFQRTRKSGSWEHRRARSRKIEALPGVWPGGALL